MHTLHKFLSSIGFQPLMTVPCVFFFLLLPLDLFPPDLDDDADDDPPPPPLLLELLPFAELGELRPPVAAPVLGFALLLLLLVVVLPAGAPAAAVAIAGFGVTTPFAVLPLGFAAAAAAAAVPPAAADAGLPLAVEGVRPPGVHGDCSCSCNAAPPAGAAGAGAPTGALVSCAEGRDLASNAELVPVLPVLLAAGAAAAAAPCDPGLSPALAARIS